MNSTIAFYQQRLNLKNASFTLIEHEDAIVATVYRIVQSDGTEVILKICQRSHDYLREVFFLKHFANQLPVPKIVQVIEPTTNIHGAVLMQCLPGTILKKTDLNETLAYELGTLLARIHLNRTSGYGDLTQPKSLTADPRVPFTEKFEEGLDECADHLPKSLIDQCREYYDAHCDLLNSVDGPCMIHRDFRPGNMIVNNGKLQGIIDWSSARSSFAEDDFCPLEIGAWSSKPKIKTAFLSGYASVRPVPHYQALMPLLRLSRIIAAIGFMVKRGTWDGSSSHFYKSNRHLLDAFFKENL